MLTGHPSAPFAQLEFLEVLLDCCLGIGRGGHAGGEVLWLLHPQLMPHVSCRQLLCQSAQLRLALDLQHDLPMA